MGTETVNHISDLNSANPLAGDNVSKGDDHIRNIKKALLADFPNINATVSATPTQLDYTTVTALGTAEASKALTVSLQSTMTFNGMTVTDLGTVTTADINGGTLDGVAIGDASRSSIKGTTIDASQSLVLATGATVTGIIDDDSMATATATNISTSEAIKAYVDSIIYDTDRAAVGHIKIKTGANVGIMVEWGKEVDAGSAISITFSPTFSATPYSLVATNHASGNVDNSVTVNSLSSSSCSITSGGTADGVYWIAIGPVTF